ncbi:MAG: DHHA1 domain-containing protein, partial [Schleiferiaceae bacterium]|nr:DHHA1 domain-containing protein [Schleiferiaceae bacterium]
HQALREVLGEHVAQKGSLVHPDYLRFDFSHVAKMTTDEIQQVEQLVNHRIQENLALQEHRAISMDNAKEMGAMMLFGEKYGDEVRAITFGTSVELCGGTHVTATGAIGLFKIVSEGAVAAGIRRIEAVSGTKAIAFVNEQLTELAEVKALLKGTNPIQAIEKLKNENSDLTKEIERLQQEKAREILTNIQDSAEQIGDFTLIAKTLPLDANAIKSICFEQRQATRFVGLYGNRAGDKVTLSLVLSDDVIATTDLKAGTLIKELSREIRGGGGGQPFFATAGGSDASGLERAYDKIKNILKAL